jgi:hypothetical protein
MLQIMLLLLQFGKVNHYDAVAEIENLLVLSFEIIGVTL